MQYVQIQSPDRRTVEHVLIELGYTPDQQSEFASDWYSPTDGTRCFIGKGARYSVVDNGVFPVYYVKWL